jgi:ketosteroid isomerase-like protein
VMSEDSTTPHLADLMRQPFEASNRHDLDASMRLFAPDAGWDLSDLGIGTFEGEVAIRKFVEDWWGTWAEHLVEVGETVDLGQGVTFASVREDGRLVGSDGHVEHTRGWIFLWDGSIVERAIIYLDIDEARAAAERLAEERE